MTSKKRERILRDANLLYHAFPVDTPYGANHKIIIKMCEVIKRVDAYQEWHIFGKDALPKHYIGQKYNEFCNAIQLCESKLERKEPAIREAQQAISDAEDLLNWIFCRA